MAKNSSFLPEDYLDRKIARRTNFICIALFVVMFMAIGAAYFVQGRQSSAIHEKHAMVNAQFAERAQQLRQIEQLQERKQQMIGKAKIVQQLVERVPRSIILAEMINHMPSTLSLLELNLETKIVKPGARPQTAIERDRLERGLEEAEQSGEVVIEPREIHLEIVGVAPDDTDVSEFMQNLTEHPLYVAVGLEYTERFMIEGVEMRRFRIVMQLNTELTFDRDQDSELLRELQQDPMAEDREFRGANGEGTTGEGFTNVRTNTD